ncbi:MAG: hypothetical protein K2M95_04465 [Clostridiales bacterium]|nr:hypothetical protein [Clostridiales bacterium]
MSVTRYPVILVHGIILKDNIFFKSFGKIGKRLKKCGYCVSTAPTDGFGTIENNAAQLKAYVEKVLEKEHAEKVNLIAHSKGGLDSIYMIENLGMEDKVASLTTLCTPHLGSPIASYILGYPKWLLKFIAFWINLWYRIFGDKHPDCLEVCRQLRQREEADVIHFSEKVYCQSYSTTLKRAKDDFIMGIPYIFSKRLEKKDTDGLVAVDSSKFGNYRGNCIEEESVSHSEIVGFMAKRKKKERIIGFYLQLLDELTEMGF